MLAERGLDIRGLGERVDETHLAVKQRAGFHKVVDHLVLADLPVSEKGRSHGGDLISRAGRRGDATNVGSICVCSLVFIQFSKLAEVREVVPDRLEFVPGDVAVAVCVEVLEY